MAKGKEIVLTFVSTKDMLEELQGRMDSLVFVGQSSRTEEEDELIAVFKGTLHSCLGLCAVSEMMVKSGEYGNERQE